MNSLTSLYYLNCLYSTSGGVLLHPSIRPVGRRFVDIGKPLYLTAFRVIKEYSGKAIPLYYFSMSKESMFMSLILTA
ncbi:inactivated superfamily I helicase [Erwinia persicina]|nr:inactivated superfamily I helicase [Erwinia persicina]